MDEEIIQIPTIKGSSSDFDLLFALWEQAKKVERGVCFKFSKCKSLRPHAIAILGGLVRLIESQSVTVNFDWNSFPEGSIALNDLSQSGFAEKFGHSQSKLGVHSVPYREDEYLDRDGIMDYLTSNWIGKDWVHVSERLMNAIAGKVWEIYNNAFEHSDSDIGIFSCGQHFVRSKLLLLAVVDFGQGIPAKARAYVDSDPQSREIPADKCLQWAFRRGTSTSGGDIAKGLGLDLLKEFVTLNDGILEVYSNEGYAIINKDGERYENQRISFDGTVVLITLQCDESYYRFRDEADD